MVKENKLDSDDHQGYQQDADRNLIRMKTFCLSLLMMVLFSCKPDHSDSKSLKKSDSKLTQVSDQGNSEIERHDHVTSIPPDASGSEVLPESPELLLDEQIFELISLPSLDVSPPIESDTGDYIRVRSCPGASDCELMLLFENSLLFLPDSNETVQLNAQSCKLFAITPGPDDVCSDWGASLSIQTNPKVFSSMKPLLEEKFSLAESLFSISSDIKNIAKQVFESWCQGQEGREESFECQGVAGFARMKAVTIGSLSESDIRAYLSDEWEKEILKSQPGQISGKKSTDIATLVQSSGESQEPETLSKNLSPWISVLIGGVALSASVMAALYKFRKNKEVTRLQSEHVRLLFEEFEKRKSEGKSKGTGEFKSAFDKSDQAVRSARAERNVASFRFAAVLGGLSGAGLGVAAHNASKDIELALTASLLTINDFLSASEVYFEESDRIFKRLNELNEKLVLETLAIIKNSDP